MMAAAAAASEQTHKTEGKRKLTKGPASKFIDDEAACSSGSSDDDEMDVDNDKDFINDDSEESNYEPSDGD